MERYDGKTRKDDIKKWTLIVSAVVIAFVGLQVGIHFLKKANAPDYIIVDMCNGTLKDEALETVREAAVQVIDDKNGNGKVTVDFKQIMPAVFGGYGDGTDVIFNGDYVLFLMLDPSPWGKDILAETVELTDAKFWKENHVDLTVYGCILNTNEKDMAEAERIIKALQEQGVDEQEPGN